MIDLFAIVEAPFLFNFVNDALIYFVIVEAPFLFSLIKEYSGTILPLSEKPTKSLGLKTGTDLDKHLVLWLGEVDL